MIDWRFDMENAPLGEKIIAAEGGEVMIVIRAINRQGKVIWPCAAYDMCGLDSPTAWASINAPEGDG